MSKAQELRAQLHLQEGWSSREVLPPSRALGGNLPVLTHPLFSWAALEISWENIFLWLIFICIALSQTTVITCSGSVLAFKFLSSHAGQKSLPPYLFPGAKGWTPRSSKKCAQLLQILYPQLTSNHQQPDTLDANKTILKMKKISMIRCPGVTHPNIFTIRNKDDLLVAGVAAGRALKWGGAARSSTTAQRNSCTHSLTSLTAEKSPQFSKPNTVKMIFAPGNRRRTVKIKNALWWTEPSKTYSFCTCEEQGVLEALPSPGRLQWLWDFLQKCHLEYL